MKDDNTSNEIINIMQLNQADRPSMRTRFIADNVGLTIHQARYYLEKLRKNNIVKRTTKGRGKKIAWLLNN
ncbi:faeA-like family protein [Salmonella enterica subsp. diarizonae serovar 61:z52:z53]|nr:faeA-like family protein [Salmonella enterica subsp. diarizonae serovar 61:z52:z53]EHG6221505.1 faeA-like family protein [Salmonella enterica subsp. diarizonae serovar 61:z52:z53]